MAPRSVRFVQDRLFDLRDDLRAWCVQNGHPLDSEQYKACRDFLNASLRYLERFNTLDMMAYMATMPEESPILDELSSDFETAMTGENPSLNAKISTMQKESFTL